MTRPHAARRARRASAPLASTQELRGALVPKQVRSVDAMQRILVAAQDLFASAEYDDVSIADIARAADLSVGTFYTRFPTKEHLVVVLLGSVMDELREFMSREMRPSRLARNTVADLVRQYLTMMGRAFVKHRGLLRPATLIARQTRDAALQSLIKGFNDDVHSRFRTMLLDRLPPHARMNGALHVDLAILWSSAAMREVLLYGEPVSSLARRHQTLIDELTRGVTLYLETPNAN